MTKFIKKSSFFILLIIIYLGIGEFFLYRINENISITTCIERQLKSKNEYYYGRTLFGEVTSRYKYEALIKKKPKIYTVGQSVSLGFRDFFFDKRAQDFYNTGLMVRNVNDFSYLIKQIEEGIVTKPEFLIFAFDHSLVLDSTFLDSKKWLEELAEDPVNNWKNHLRAIQQVYLKKEVREVPKTNLGVGKKGMIGTGFRRDGSFNNSWELEIFLKDSSHTHGPLKEQFLKHDLGFPEIMNFSESKKIQVFNDLKKLRMLGVEIVVYFPPLSDEFYDFALQNENFKSFWIRYLEVQKELKVDHFDVIEFATPKNIGLTKYHMLNDNHPTEIFIANLFLNYCKSENKNCTFMDKIGFERLEKELKKVSNPISFLKDPIQ